jgi:hypothetical protein
MLKAKNWVSVHELRDLIVEAVTWHKLHCGPLAKPQSIGSDQLNSLTTLDDEIALVFSSLRRAGVLTGEGKVVACLPGFLDGPWIEGANDHIDLLHGTVGSGRIWDDLEALGSEEIEPGLRLRYGSLAGQAVFADEREAEGALRSRYDIGIVFARELKRIP